VADSFLEDQRHLVGATDVEVITDDALEPGAACLRVVEDHRVRDLKLPESELVDVAGVEVLIS
jgi:hypothetical protein